MKKILGLDLGTTSIGWALVNEAENENEKSSIIKLGVRVDILTNDEQENFKKGKSITTNAGRTLKRGMRRNLQRYKLRRENLIEILKDNGFITDETILSENGENTTLETYHLRAKAVTEEITLEQFARVLLMINKKRGYKSNRKVKGDEEGTLIDGMEVAKLLYEENLTPGQYCLQLMEQRKKGLPDFYRSDLQMEFDKIWTKQQEFYPEILTDKLKENLANKNEKETWGVCKEPFNIVGIQRTTKGEELKKEKFELRAKALSEKMDLESLAVVLQDINGQLKKSSSYLGAISDRSKELYFNKQTVGQYQLAVLTQNPNATLRKMIFYRQDYLDEFHAIWDKQAEFHKELTEELKKKIRDEIIFYQRRLKSQKGLISFCEFESKQIEVEKDGKKKIITVGSRVIPRSSPLFQEFKIWQKLNDIEIFPSNEKNKKRKPNARRLEQEEKELLFEELSIKEKLTNNQILELLDLQEFDMNFKNIDGNKTQYELFKAYKKMIEISGCKIDDDFSAETVYKFFKQRGINTDILYFDSQLPLDEQPMYKLYHLLYSFEGDKSKSGVEKLIAKLKDVYGFEEQFAKILIGAEFQKDYGSLSAKAIRKILPLMKMGQDYTTACSNIYERHSASSLTNEELKKKAYKDKLEILPKNSLRNPVVEKILNQMINVVNTIIDTYGKPDEIRIELARELKKNADERFLLTKSISSNTENVERIREKLKENPIFKTCEPSRNDILRYQLYEELAPNGFKPLFGSKENLQKAISERNLFTNEIQIEHILPKTRLLDNSFSNKTLVFSEDNLKKDNNTAIDYVKMIGGDLNDYLNRIISVCGTKTIKKVITNKKTGDKKVETKTISFEKLYKEHEKGLKNQKEKIEKWNAASEKERAKLVKPWALMSDVEKKLEVINKYYSNKLKKLVITESELPEGFINRDLANTQYITKQARKMLADLVKSVVVTTGSVTDRLRDDWQLVDVMKEINFPKYEKSKLVEKVKQINYEKRGEREVMRIKDWSKRNDHRHHAMDALTVAFTKRQFIQYLNNLNARRTDENQSISNREDEYDNFAITTEDVILNTRDVLGIENRYLCKDKNPPRFKPPFDGFRAEAKRHLENTLVSIKAKNKVTTDNLNITKKAGGTNKKVQATPRGQLHNATIYGSIEKPNPAVEKVGANFNTEKIATVCKPAYREALLRRLQEFDNDPQKAFTGKNSLKKNPIWLNEEKTKQLPEKVKTWGTVFTQRIEVTSFTKDGKRNATKESAEKKIDKIIDKSIKKILQNRLKEFNYDPEKAFSNLDNNPIWFNKEKGISIKRVTISGISNAIALHDKRDKDGNLILDNDGKPQAVDFVETGNNHHIAIYRKPVLDKEGNHVEDEEGNKKYELEENVVSFYEAVSRKKLGLPVIDKTYKVSEGWQFLFTMKKNEYFVFPRTEKAEKTNEETGETTEVEKVVFDPNDIDLLNPANYALISPNLFRVESISPKDYGFRHHLETNKDQSRPAPLKTTTWVRVRTPNHLNNIVKVRVNHIGEIVEVGEY